MKFVASRELRIRPGSVWKALKKEKELVITCNGQPVCVMAAVTGQTLEATLLAFRRARLGETLRELQRQARERGVQMTDEEIDELIQDVRRKRRARACAS